METVEPEAIQNDLITQTVYGFLDFTTTIGNTIMVFSPQSAPPPGNYNYFFFLLTNTNDIIHNSIYLPFYFISTKLKTHFLLS